MITNFTIAFICHNEGKLLSETIKNNLITLCENTSESYETILVLDGFNKVNFQEVIDLGIELGIDEIRLRNRIKCCASGDGANNGHIHTFSEKSKYLITVEGDIAVFKHKDNCDILKEIRETFERTPNLALATKIDDYDCWIWKLERIHDHFIGNGITSVNRVSSHFLIYDTERCKKYLRDKDKGLDLNIFYDNGVDTWYNYEDYISYRFVYPEGPGIGFLDELPLGVYHCDRKISSESSHYVRNLDVKMAEFFRRKAESEKLLSQNMGIEG